MKILIAGAGGDLGTEIARLLIEGGHDVFGLTRSESKGRELGRRGVRPVIGDLLDARSTTAAVEKAKPDAVMQVPIALPQRGPIRIKHLDATNRLRIVGTRHLLEASLTAGVERYLAESIVAIYGYGDLGDQELDESSPTAKTVPLDGLQPAIDALKIEETMVLDESRAGRIHGIVARVGFYYGTGVESTAFIAKLLKRGIMPVTKTRGALPWVELSDAAAGMVTALEQGRAGAIYNVVGDESAGLTDLAIELARQLDMHPPRELPTWLIRLGGPYAAVMSETKMRVSNGKARQELGWAPRFPTIEEGIKAAVPWLREIT